MTSSDLKADAAPTSGWRFKLGIGTFVTAFALLPAIPIAASLGASGTTIAALTGTILVTNKILLMTCVVVMEKPVFNSSRRARWTMQNV